MLRTHRACASAFVIALGLTGCASAQTQHYHRLREKLREATPPAPRPDEPEAVADLLRLDRQAFIRAVLARNPSIAAARQSWRAALARYPQVTALADPRVEYSLAPLSIASSDVRFGQVVALSQHFPWPGKLALEGQVALAEAEAARGDYRATRLRLALVASLLFDQYYATDRALDLNAEHALLVKDIKAAALAQYQAGRASQDQPLKADLELAHVEHQRAVLKARRATLQAQMNELLHRRPAQPLPPPPDELSLDLEAVAASEVLQARALEQRPELRATQARVRGQQAAVDLAHRRYYPDVGVMASYDSMWAAPEHRWMVGVSLRVPIQLGAKAAAKDEADARLDQTRSELSALAATIRTEVEIARQKLIEAQHVVHLYRQRLIPTVRAQIEAAQIAYATGRGSFQSLIDAERSLRSIELAHESALATLAGRSAELMRATGQIPGLTADEVNR